ncbi:hypothetical protein QN277_001542 [Acacia crassicarpa]|uniref:Uncharacterized protein n=1 Tax=Acacia crassicarpa TaxID=499986 RepID=A0AAE1N7J1_9FABA|nr:hypothetical protein QN277_001542 [Acacia crassicarpa]
MNIDYAIRKDEPPSITVTSTPDQVDLYEKWERSNRLSVMFIKTSISVGIRGFVEQHNKIRPLLKAIDEQLWTSDKAFIDTLIMKFSSPRLTAIKNVYKHIILIRDIEAQLKSLEVNMSDSFLVHYISNTLLQPYRPFRISCNTHEYKWSINKRLTMCVQEEGRLKMQMGEFLEYDLISGSDQFRKFVFEKDHLDNQLCTSSLRLVVNNVPSV